MKIYKGFEEARNGTTIPVFLSGRTMESRYNPQRDAENLLGSITNEGTFNFYVVLGIGSGLFIKLLSEKNPQAVILALELYDEDIDFLLQNDYVKTLSKKDNIIFTSLSNLETNLTQNYLPAKYGNLKIIEQRAWVNENAEHIESINSILKKTLGIISADYSVQAHFGKIWNSNIMNNAFLAEKFCRQNNFSFTKDIINKTAVIVAAGPSLDKSISILKNQSEVNPYFVISTDTASQTLIQNQIIPQVIISIDGQSVSYNHFIKKTEGCKESLYLFDLCANSSAAKNLLQKGYKVDFFCSGHPLSTAINSVNHNYFPTLFSGAGTVTITALDLAIQSGFKDIFILGADFSYINGKAYAAGTYLDTLYNQKASKLKQTEEVFSKLMYRTELKELSSNIKTTQILEAYKTSMEKYLESNNISFSKEKDIYKLSCIGIPKNQGLFYYSADNSKTHDFSIKSFFSKLNNANSQESEIILLPYIAWLRNNSKYKNLSYSELQKLALGSIVRYNI